MSFVADGSSSLSPKNEVSVGITFTIKMVTVMAIPTTRRTGYVMAPLIFRVMESTFSVWSAIWRSARLSFPVRSHASMSDTSASLKHP